MTDLQVERDDIIEALRARITELVYENALLAAAVAKLQRASAAQPSAPSPAAMPPGLM
ncbi:hypothetical protein [Nonomuraea sp. LPB2021202275-12-8]|uniref:hypothetical protein n=1 Tax=Nonomuraea sp. LPB2021202275-12-8 TaxID=3120159 RepID=UPI00300C7702